MNKVVVTGASGHIGYHVAKLLFNRFKEVHLLVRRKSPNIVELERMGATVVPVEEGSRTLKDAINEAFRDWAAHYSYGSESDGMERLATVLAPRIVSWARTASGCPSGTAPSASRSSGTTATSRRHCSTTSSGSAGPTATRKSSRSTRCAGCSTLRT